MLLKCALVQSRPAFGRSVYDEEQPFHVQVRNKQPSPRRAPTAVAFWCRSAMVPPYQLTKKHKHTQTHRHTNTHKHTNTPIQTHTHTHTARESNCHVMGRLRFAPLLTVLVNADRLQGSSPEKIVCFATDGDRRKWFDRFGGHSNLQCWSPTFNPSDFPAQIIVRSTPF